MEWTVERRRKLKDGEIEGDFAGPDMSYPIASPSDVNDAWGLAGHASNPNAVRRAIIRIAKKFGWESGLPKTAQAFSLTIEDARKRVQQSSDPRIEFHYVDDAESNHCQYCRFFNVDSCDLLPGLIQPEGSCDLYQEFDEAEALSVSVEQAFQKAIADIPDPRAEFHYVDATPIPEINCSRCRFFEPPSGCKLIDGEIQPGGVCDLFTMEGVGKQDLSNAEGLSMKYKKQACSQTFERCEGCTTCETECEKSEELSVKGKKQMCSQTFERCEGCTTCEDSCQKTEEEEVALSITVSVDDPKAEPYLVEEEEDEEVLSIRFSDDFDADLEAFAVSLTKEDKDPEGGLTAAGRKKYNSKTGSNLKPGVKGTPRTREDFRRKGSFLTRFYTDPSGPLVDDKGEPTRLAKAACLHASTPVLLADGSFRVISEIVNERLPVEVICFDFEKNEFTTATVSNWLKRPSSLREFIAVDDLTIVTKDHLILTQDGWKAAESIAGDERAVFNEGEIDFHPTQLSRPAVPNCEWKYDIEVPVHHNFVAFRTVVHNSAWGETPPRTVEQAHRLAAKGRRLLERAKEMQKMSQSPEEILSQSGEAVVESTIEAAVDEVTGTVEFSVEVSAVPEVTPSSVPESTVEVFSEIPNAELVVLSNGMVKVPLAKKGAWKHAEYDVVSFDDQDFADMKRNFENNALGFTPYLTFGHDIATIENPHAVDAQLKKGELLSMEIDGDVLWGVFNPKEDARKYIESGEYEYNSPEVLRSHVDKKTGNRLGATLIRTALTNSPFIPFNEIKVQALSVSESRPLSSMPFMVKVNVESPESGTNSMTDTTPQVETFDKEEFKAEIQQMLSTFTAEVAALKAENESLKQELVDTKTRQESFSSLISQQEEAHVLSQMAKAGVSPAFIQRFSTLKSELVQAGAASRPIALSISGKEEVRPLVNELALLLVEAIHAKPEEAVVEVQQLGVSSTEKPAGVNDWIKQRAQEVLAKAKKQSAE